MNHSPGARGTAKGHGYCEVTRALLTTHNVHRAAAAAAASVFGLQHCRVQVQYSLLTTGELLVASHTRLSQGHDVFGNSTLWYIATFFNALVQDDKV